jgi:hypothetical protein
LPSHPSKQPVALAVKASLVTLHVNTASAHSYWGEIALSFNSWAYVKLRSGYADVAASDYSHGADSLISQYSLLAAHTITYRVRSFNAVFTRGHHRIRLALYLKRTWDTFSELRRQEREAIFSNDVKNAWNL